MLAVTAVTLFAVAGCSDRPNDLDTYYDDPRPSGVAADPDPANPGTTAGTPSPAAAPAPAARPIRLDTAVLSDADVAGEGVHPFSSPQAAGTCLAGLGEVATKLRIASWRYPTGSTLGHQVTGYRTARSARAALDTPCVRGTPFAPAVPPTLDAHRAWCDGTTCTAMLSHNRVVSAVQVVAGTPDRAREAVQRIAPIAAGKLLAARP